MPQTPEPLAETPQSYMADGRLWPTLGPVFIAWSETYLTHGEGDLLGRPYRCPAWLRRAAYRLFEYDPTVTHDMGGTDAHPYIVRESLIVTPKGAAKTEGMAAIALFLLAGPSLPTPHGPVVRTAANIPVAAASWEQANKLLGLAARNMAEGTADSPAPLATHVECFETEIQCAESGGKLYRVAAVGGTNDGALPTAAIADEIHEWTGRKERVHLVLFQGLGKRVNGLGISITTPDAADPESLLGRKVAYGQRVASGEEDDAGYYYLHYGAEPSMPLVAADGNYDLDLVVAAVKAAHPAEWMDHLRVARMLVVDRMPEHEFRRYWLAQFVPSGGTWLPEGAWDARHAQPYGDGKRLPPDGTRIVTAFDGSYNRDSTALVGCTLDGYLFLIRAWERPDDAGPDWRVPRSEVSAVVDEAMRRWDVVEMACDPFGWHSEIEQWEDTYGDAVLVYKTNNNSLMVPAVSRFYAAVAGGESDDAPLPITHDGHPTVARHLRHCVPAVRPGGEIVTKRHRDSPQKIDVAIAAIIAYDRAHWHASEANHADDNYGPALLVL